MGASGRRRSLFASRLARRAEYQESEGNAVEPAEQVVLPQPLLDPELELHVSARLRMCHQNHLLDGEEDEEVVEVSPLVVHQAHDQDVPYHVEVAGFFVDVESGIEFLLVQTRRSLLFLLHNHNQLVFHLNKL